MQKKMLIFVEVLFIIVAMVYYLVIEVIPEYKTKYGSSDSIINSSRYSNMIEFNIDDLANFGLIIDSERCVYHIMFFDRGSITLYNQDIENNDCIVVLDKIFKLLISNDILNTNSIIKITKYNDFSYKEYLDEVNKNISKYNLGVMVLENDNTLEDRAMELGISGDSGESILSYMDYYSKEVVRKYKDTELKKNINLDDDNSHELCNNVYKKIEEYIYNNEIDNLDKDNTLLMIGTIPADSSLKYYPSSNSWYYVTDGDVYAYIELINGNKKYGYCYKGSIDLRSEGECDS